MSLIERFSKQAEELMASGRAAFYRPFLGGLPGKDGAESDLLKIMDEPIKGRVVLGKYSVETSNGPVLFLTPLPDEHGEAPNLKIPLQLSSTLKMDIARSLRAGASVLLSGNMKQGLVQPTEITVDGQPLVLEKESEGPSF